MKTEKVQLSPRGTTAVAAGVLALAALWAYRGSFSAPFFFDDRPSITENETIRHLGAVGRVLSPPSEAGISVGGRPLVNLSLAVNYAWGGLDVWGYHALNLTIHLLAALTLFGVTRRTLQSAAPARRSLPEPTLLAFAIALLWTLHPLQTESVTYVVERTESLVGLFYLLTLYCFIRGVDAGRGKPDFAGGTRAEPVLRRSLEAEGGLMGEKAARITSLGWFVLSWLGCLFGMATKEVMVSAPLMVFLYDRTFVSRSFREAWRQRRRYYAGLGAAWLMLAYLVIDTGGGRGTTAGFGHGVTAWTYALTQCRAIVMYLKLAVWPHPLVVDYGTAVAAHFGEVALQAAGVVVLVVGTGWALFRRPMLGFAGAWFFLILAPSSSVVPVVTQTMAEHRMYLPLAAVIAVVVCGGYGLLARPVRGQGEASTGVWRCYLGVLLALSVGLGTLTARRNEDYRSALSIWSDTVAKRPGNARAQNNLGTALFAAGRNREALAACEEALRLRPDFAEGHDNLGVALYAEGRTQEAIAQYEQALRLYPGYADAHDNLGVALAAAGRLSEAIAQYGEALRLKPGAADAHSNLGNALSEEGRLPEAIAQYEEALRFKPDYPKAQSNLGVALMAAGRTREAMAHYEEAVRVDPDYPEGRYNFGNALAGAGRWPEAIAQYEEALRLRPGYAEAHGNLGIALSGAGRLPEAIAQFEEKLRLRPDDAVANYNLATVLARAGRLPEAIAHYERALKLRPDLAEVEDDLGIVLAKTGRVAEAIPHFERAVRLRPGSASAQRHLGMALQDAGRAEEAKRHLAEAERLQAASPKDGR